jgi:hypothetical protein
MIKFLIILIKYNSNVLVEPRETRQEKSKNIKDSQGLLQLPGTQWNISRLPDNLQRNCGKRYQGTGYF